MTQAQKAQAQGIGSQQDDGQNIWQNDINEFINLSWRRTINDHLSSILSAGLDHAGLDVLNANPAINSESAEANDPTYLPDNSIEYNPTIVRNSHSVDIQGSMTYANAAHHREMGLQYRAGARRKRGMQSLTRHAELVLPGSPVSWVRRV